MRGKLLLETVAKLICGIAVMALLLFLPAGTWKYWNAWLLGGVLFIPMLFVGIVLYVKCPELLKKRLNTKEKEVQQNAVICFSFLQFLACFILAGLDYRFGWSNLPPWVVVVATIIFATGYGIYIEVMRENVYLSRTVEIQENQKVIDTGLYGVVRHPMYFSTILVFMSMPIILGSWIAFLIMIPYPFILSKRICNEEAVLEEGLPGYREYKQKVHYRILPYIW